MVKNPEILEKFEEDFARNHQTTYEQRLKMFGEMYKLKKLLSPDDLDPLDGLDEKIEFIKRLHYAGRNIKKNS